MLLKIKKIVDKILYFLFDDRYFDFLFEYLFFRKNRANNGKENNLIIINHFFDQDIEALKLANKRFSFVIFPATLLRNIGTKIFPSQVESYEYFNSEKLSNAKERYHKIIERFTHKLIKKFNPKAVVSPSDNFFYIRDFIRTLQQNSIPFIVSDKEGTICPAYFTHFAKYIKVNCPLIADKILVWTERQKLFWQQAGTDAKKIIVVGQPRSDFWKQPSRWLKKSELGIPRLRNDGFLIVFFTYDPWAYAPDYMVEKGEMHWEDLRNQTHQCLYEFAKQHPKIDVVIKAHPQQQDIAEMQKEIDDKKISNVFLVTGSTSSNQLIVNAQAVVGFQSTTMIEAMNTHSPIIYTFWGEAKDRWSNDLIPFHLTQAVWTIESQSQLTQKLEQAFHHIALSEVELKARQDFLFKYLSFVDGHASERTLTAIENIIEKA